MALTYITPMTVTFRALHIPLDNNGSWYEETVPQYFRRYIPYTVMSPYQKNSSEIESINNVKNGLADDATISSTSYYIEDDILIKRYIRSIEKSVLDADGLPTGIIVTMLDAGQATLENIPDPNDNTPWIIGPANSTASTASTVNNVRLNSSSIMSGASLALLDNAQALLDRLNIVSRSDIQLVIEEKKNTVAGQQSTLQDINDAKETYRREYLEREAQLKNYSAPLFGTLQDWSLFILFSGYAIFMVSMLIYIIMYSHEKLLMASTFIGLSTLLGIVFVFVIQRFG